MQVFADQHERSVQAVMDRACTAELQRRSQPLDAGVPEVMAKVVELNVFKKGSMPSKGETGPVPDDRLSPDAARSLLEQLQQARYRETQHRKRVEALDYEIRIVRAQKEALRTALDLAWNEAAARETGHDSEETAPDTDVAPLEPESAPRRRLGGAWIRLFRTRHGTGGLSTLAPRCA